MNAAHGAHPNPWRKVHRRGQHDFVAWACQHSELFFRLLGGGNILVALLYSFAAECAGTQAVESPWRAAGGHSCDSPIFSSACWTCQLFRVSSIQTVACIWWWGPYNCPLPNSKCICWAQQLQLHLLTHLDLFWLQTLTALVPVVQAD